MKGETREPKGIPDKIEQKYMIQEEKHYEQNNWY